MTYEQHLRAVILEARRAIPGLSDRSMSLRAGLHAGWISQFMATGRGTIDRADRVVRTVGTLCPAGPEGDTLRDLLRHFDAARGAGGDRVEDAA